MSLDIDWGAPPEPKAAPARATPKPSASGDLPPLPRCPPRSVLPGRPDDDYLVRLATAYLSAGATAAQEPNGWRVLRMPDSVTLPPGWAPTVHMTAETYECARAIHERREADADAMRAAIAKRLAIIAEAWGDAAEAARRLTAAGEGDAACKLILEGKR